jgi:hypothetical protein
LIALDRSVVSQSFSAENAWGIIGFGKVRRSFHLLLHLGSDELISYTKGLTKSTQRLESLLKVIVTPVDPPEGFILNYTLLIGDASFSNFQKVSKTIPALWLILMLYRFWISKEHRNPQ